MNEVFVTVEFTTGAYRSALYHLGRLSPAVSLLVKGKEKEFCPPIYVAVSYLRLYLDYRV